MGKDQELLEAARNGDIKIVGKLVELATKRHGPLSSFRRSPSLNCTDMNGYTALHHACLNGHSNIVRLLIAHEAQINVPDIRGSTPLYLAAWAGHHDIVKMLLMNSPNVANPNAQTIENETPLHSAAQHGHNKVVSILLAYGADPCIRNNSFQTALDLAAQFGRLQVVQILLRSQPDLIAAYRNPSDNYASGYAYTTTPYTTTPTKHIFTHTCLHLSSRNGHKKVVEVLLAAGVNVNILTPAGSALHEAALCGKKSVVLTLLKAGININATDANGRTALDILRDYPPHVTYDIVTVINEFCNIPMLHFQPIDQVQPTHTVDTVHTLPKRLYERNVQKPKNARLDFVPKPRNDQPPLPSKTKKNGLSNSLSSLDKYTTAPEAYLKMKPIKWQASNTDLGSYKPVYKQAYQGALLQSRKSNEFTGAFIPSRSYEYINLIHDNSTTGSDEQQTNNSSDEVAAPFSQYRCVDEYVQMSEPSSTPQPSPRLKDSVDYANLDFVKPNSATYKATLVDGNNNNEQVVSRSKTHSPTPDYPPPTVTEAEHTIFEFMQPLTLQTKHQSLLQDMEIDFTGESETPRTLSSAASDFVEQFLGDAPFSGLFKGSTINLTQDEPDIGQGGEPLRSPSLIKSLSGGPSNKRSLSKQRFSVNGEDFSASRVWAEIDTIFESIGNEVHSVEQLTKSTHEDLQIVKDAVETNVERPSLHMRNPSELLLTEGETQCVPATNWCHSPYTLLYGEIRYTVYYLGSTVIRQLQGTASTRKSIQKLKIDEGSKSITNATSLIGNCNSSTKYLKVANMQNRLEVGIAVSHAGVKFIDQEQKSTICLHDIENINCVCQDAEDLRYFAYLTKENDLHYCHVFMVDNLELAKEIILTLGQAFEVAYQLALSRQCHPIEE